MNIRMCLLIAVSSLWGGVYASDDGWNGIRGLTFATPKGKAEEKVRSPSFGWMSGRNLYKKLSKVCSLESCPPDAEGPLKRAITALKKKAKTPGHEKDKKKYEELAGDLEAKFFGGAVSSLPETGQPKEGLGDFVIAVESDRSVCSSICSSRNSDSPDPEIMHVPPATPAQWSEQKTGGSEAVAPTSPVRSLLVLDSADTGAPRVDSDEEVGELPVSPPQSINPLYAYAHGSLQNIKRPSSDGNREKDGRVRKMVRSLSAFASSKRKKKEIVEQPASAPSSPVPEPDPVAPAEPVTAAYDWDDVINLKIADREKIGFRIQSPSRLRRNITTDELCEKLEAVPDSGCPPEARKNLTFMVKELYRKYPLKDDSELRTRCETQIKRLVEKHGLSFEEEEAEDPQEVLQQDQAVEEPAISDASPDPEDARQKYYIMAVVVGALLMDWAVRRDKSIIGGSIAAVKKLWSYLRGVKKQDEEAFDSAVDQAKELLAQEGIIPEE